jgi:hypothetical protein
VSLAPSLRSRVKRLEQSVGPNAPVDCAVVMRAARELRLSMTPEQRITQEVARDAAAVRSLTEPDEPRGTQAEKVQRIRRSRGRRLLAASFLSVNGRPSVDASVPPVEPQGSAGGTSFSLRTGKDQ